MAHFRGGAVAVVRESLRNHGNAAGAVPFVNDTLEVVGIAAAQSLFNGALNVVVGHVDGLGLGDDRGQPGVVVRVSASARLDRNNHFPGNFCKGLGALCVGSALGLLNVVPFGMS
ncbi:hypothetical protein SDC9_99873 [bioreactor metagenome]|uniref:Uncharacterized protein n=1 Tax=bioreactor metagenome TaxID=1076179 RepID=A0A645AIW2_9ZZZZ